MNKKEIFYLSLCIFLSVVAWLIADLRHASTSEQLHDDAVIPNVKQYTIDKTLLDKLGDKNN